MTAMASRDYGRGLVVAGRAWMISSPTSSGEDCLASWGGKGAEGGVTGAGGEERIWCTPSSELAKGSRWNAQMALFGVNQRIGSCLFWGILT